MTLSHKRPSKGEEIRTQIMQDVIEISDSKKRLNVDIEASLFKRIKIRAAEEGRTIADITSSLWSEYIDKHS
jgi:predicted DNA binding CopG/RHH family protein